MNNRLCWWIASRLPKRVVYFAAIRLMAHATVGAYSKQIVPELYATDALQRWERDCLR